MTLNVASFLHHSSDPLFNFPLNSPPRPLQPVTDGFLSFTPPPFLVVSMLSWKDVFKHSSTNRKHTTV